MGLAIVGAGFGRTGTLSLKLAIEKLGLGPCYHMLEAMKRPEHLPVWVAAGRGDEVDWPALFEGFNATVDWPGARFWRELSDLYPESKVVLSVRPADAWYASAKKTIYRAMTTPLPDDHPGSPQRNMAREIVLDRTFEGRFEDEAFAKAVYERHNQEVRETIPAERLLVYEVGSGWQPLCRFFDRPVPDADYPRVNSSDDFENNFPTLRP